MQKYLKKVLHVRTYDDNIKTSQRKRGDKMKKQPRITARILADVEPSVKEKLQEIASLQNESMANVLVNLIEKKYFETYGISKGGGGTLKNK